ncbi:hypothetical protein LJR277_000838 [Pseudomonas sp. LjRoot277]|uniref:hypothetical protein n=1 Tax=Pseudomonas sp. LjRoot277 TaxID=3342307 RepID=UPI003ECE4A71
MSFWKVFSKREPSVPQTTPAQSVPNEEPLPISCSPPTHISELVSVGAPGGYGAFADLDRDLGLLTKDDLDKSPMATMAYGYARRIVGYGLYFQGLVDEKHIGHVQKIFEHYQLHTEQTVRFQEIASSQALDLLRLYEPAASAPIVVAIIDSVHKGFNARHFALPGSEESVPGQQWFTSETCMAIVQRMIESGTHAGHPESKSTWRLIDVVEKEANDKLGPFANMYEDLKASRKALEVHPHLLSAAGHAIWLAGAGTFVAGGVHEQIVIDCQALMNSFNEGSSIDLSMHSDAFEQALVLARTYVPALGRESAAEIIASAKDFVNFSSVARLSVQEVVDLANQRSIDKSEGLLG